MYTTSSSRITSSTKQAPLINVVNLPSDTISDICINENLVAITSWDCSVRIYQISKMKSAGGYLQSSNLSLTPFKLFASPEIYNSPVLTVALTQDNNFFWAGLGDGSIVIQSTSNEAYVRKISDAHTGAVKSIRLFQNGAMISVGLLDGKIKMWDIGAGKEMTAMETGSKIYCMDMYKEHLVVGLANKQVKYFNLITNSSFDLNLANDLKYQIRDVAVIPNTRMGGYSSSGNNQGASQVVVCVGTIDGKTSIYSSSNTGKPEAVFRNHREKPKCFSINKCNFLPTNPDIIVTAGSDGKICFLNKSSRSKIYENLFSSPITAMACDSNCLIFATGNDWSKGYSSQSYTIEMKYIDLSVLKEIPKKFNL